MAISIIIPVYNEEKTIEKIIYKTIAAKVPDGVKKEIIVVDDGSKDNSRIKINNANLRLKIKNFSAVKIKTIFKKKNEGKGAAVKAGLKIATGDIILIQDADLEYDPNYYSILLKPILEKKTKVVYGTRIRRMSLFIFGPQQTPFITHYLANRFLSFLTNLLYGSNITDMETGYKVFTKEVYRKIGLLEANGFNFEPEITAKILKNNFNIFEVDIETKPRSYEEGKKIQWDDGIIAVYTLFKHRFTKNI
jgi:glycosyltransferase involved in cell wall biosynthesis